METTVSARKEYSVVHVAIAQIAASSLNPRRSFPQAELKELADSIREHGLIQPIVLRPLDAAGARGKKTAVIPIRFDKERGETVPRGDYRFEIVAGERRWQAATLAGLETVPAIVREDLSDQAALRLAIVENVQRSDLNPMEEADGFRRLSEMGLRQAEIAAEVQRNPATVSNTLRLLDLPPDVQTAIREGKLSRAHGVAICSLRDHPAAQGMLGETAVRRSWTTAATEEAVRELAKLQQWPDLMVHCLEPDGKALAQKLEREGWHMPATVAERVKFALQRQAVIEEKRRVEGELRAAGKTVLKVQPSYDNKKFEELSSYGDQGRVHKAAGLTCEAFYVDASGQVFTRHYCTDPKALKNALGAAIKDKPRSDHEIKQEEEKRIRTARAKARDVAIDRWARDFQMPAVDDLMMFARKRVDSLVKYEDTPLLYMANRLGVPGKSKAEKIDAVKEQLKAGVPKDMIRAWILAELSTAGNSYDPVPSWMQPWLESQGYVDPAAPPTPPPAAEPEAAAAPAPPSPNGRCRDRVVMALHWSKDGRQGTHFACEAHAEGAAQDLTATGAVFSGDLVPAMAGVGLACNYGD